jgi:plasmid replication initiation protein
MAMQLLTLPGELVKKHNELVRSKINIASKTASRILACLVASIRRDDTQFKDAYVVPLNDYLPHDEVSKGGKQYKLIKEACRDLIAATVEKEWPDPDNPEGDPIFHVMPFLTSIKYRKGKVAAKFNPEMSELLLQLHQCFTQYNLMEYLTLPSLYSQRLFEILKSWSNTPDVVIPVSELHRLLDTPASFRADFRQFRVYVLGKAKKDIHKKTSLRFEWEAIKQGRSVVSIRFCFDHKRKTLVAAKNKKVTEDKTRIVHNRLFLAAVACRQARGEVCEGGAQKPKVCELCRTYR